MDFVHPEQEQNLAAIGELLRRERPTLTFDERQRLDRRVDAVRTPRRPRRSGSRLAVVICMVLGLLFTSAGTGLAIGGLASDGAAEQAQYPDRTGPSVPAPTRPTARSSGPVSGAHGAPSSLGTVPPTAGTGSNGLVMLRQAESRNQLPFTGFGAIPVLVAGIGLMIGGGIIHRRARPDSGS